MRSLHLLNSSLGLEPLLKQILKTACEEIRAARSTLYLMDPPPGSTTEGRAPVLRAQVTAASRNIHFEVPWGQGVVGRVVETGIGQIVHDTGRSPDFLSVIDKKTHFQTRNLLTVPMRNKDGIIIGALQVLNRRRGRFSQEDLNFLSAFADHAAVSIERERLIEAYVRDQRLREQLALARQIQEQLLPAPALVDVRLELRAFTQACEGVGGDLFDYQLNEGGQFYFSLGDVSGKGMPAALLMSATQVTMRTLWQSTSDPGEILSRLNALISRTTHFRSFVTLFLGVLNFKSRILRYVNAGHIPPLLCSKSGRWRSLTAGGLVVGILPEVRYEVGEVSLVPGDRVVVVSDGFTEAFNPAGEEFGMGRLKKQVVKSKALSAEEALRFIIRSVDEFAQGRPPADDRTLLLLDIR